MVITRYLPDLCGICKVYTELMWYVRVIVVMIFRHFTDVCHVRKDALKPTTHHSQNNGRCVITSKLCSFLLALYFKQLSERRSPLHLQAHQHYAGTVAHKAGAFLSNGIAWLDVK